MKKIFLSSAVAVCAAAMVSCNGGVSTNVSLKTAADSAAYSIGVVNGQMFSGSLTNLPGDSLNRNVLVAGLADALLGKDVKISAEDANTFLQSYFERVETMAKEKNLKEGEEFLAKNKTAEGVQTTESGLQYKIEKLGDGEKALSPADTVVVHYKGVTLDGKQFDSSYDRNEPATFPLDRVIKGWTEAFQLVPAGSKFTLWIPSDLAYGERGPGEIGPNRTLRFDCELLEVHHAVEKK